jgi:methionyl aminopeptidase
MRTLGHAPRILSSDEIEKMRTACRVGVESPSPWGSQASWYPLRAPFLQFISSTPCSHKPSLTQLGREVLDIAASHVRPGITTDEIDAIVHQATIDRNAYPSPLGYRNFPKSVCT